MNQGHELRPEEGKTANNLTAARLQEVLDYDQETGIFRWKAQRGGRAKVGCVAGGLHKSDGYWRISVDDRYYAAHCLAWLYVTGKWPATEVDHVNMDKSDNRFTNLREATRSQNSWNRHKYKNNTTGFKGVTKPKEERHFRAQITINRRSRNLGHFSTPEAAHAVYLAAAKKHFGKYARAE